MQDLGKHMEEEAEKPIFWHSLHKRMWDLVALGMTKREALECIKAEDNLPDTWRPLNACFACEAVAEYGREYGTEGTSCAMCPLIWHVTKPSIIGMPCMRGVYNKWVAANMHGMKAKARELACEIRDIPFSYAINLYEVK